MCTNRLQNFLLPTLCNRFLNDKPQAIFRTPPLCWLLRICLIFITAFVIILEGNSCHWNTFITAAKWTLLSSFELLHNDQYSHIKPVNLVWRLLALHCLCCIVTNFTSFFYYPYNLLTTCNLDHNEEHSRFPELPSTPMELFNLSIQGQQFSWTVLNLGCNDFFLITPRIY